MRLRSIDGVGGGSHGINRLNLHGFACESCLEEIRDAAERGRPSSSIAVMTRNIG